MTHFQTTMTRNWKQVFGVGKCLVVCAFIFISINFLSPMLYSYHPVWYSKSAASDSKVLAKYAYETSIKVFQRNQTFRQACKQHQSTNGSNPPHPVKQSTLDIQNPMNVPALSYLPSYRSPCFHLQQPSGRQQIRYVTF